MIEPPSTFLLVEDDEDDKDGNSTAIGIAVPLGIIGFLLLLAALIVAVKKRKQIANKFQQSRQAFCMEIYGAEII